MSFFKTTTMFSRFKEFAVVMIEQDTLSADQSLWSNDQVDWMRNWSAYVAAGGTRPPRKPPV
jgi:hypothetical protein